MPISNRLSLLWAVNNWTSIFRKQQIKSPQKTSNKCSITRAMKAARRRTRWDSSSALARLAARKLSCPSTRTTIIVNQAVSRALARKHSMEFQSRSCRQVRSITWSQMIASYSSATMTQITQSLTSRSLRTTSLERTTKAMGLGHRLIRLSSRQEE